MRGYLTRLDSSYGRCVLTLCAVAMSTAGCTRAELPARPAGVVAVRPASATLVVRNHHEADLRLYIMVAGGRSHRLGLVPRLGAATLALPPGIRLPSEVRFAAIPMGHGEPQVTGPIEVDVGTRLVFTVGSAASVSTLARLP